MWTLNTAMFGTEVRTDRGCYATNTVAVLKGEQSMPFVIAIVMLSLGTATVQAKLKSTDPHSMHMS